MVYIHKVGFTKQLLSGFIILNLVFLHSYPATSKPAVLRNVMEGAEVK